MNEREDGVAEVEQQERVVIRSALALLPLELALGDADARHRRTRFAGPRMPVTVCRPYTVMS